MSFDYTVIRSKKRNKKSVIRISPDGEVEVRVPARIKDTQVAYLLEQHSAWIEKQLTTIYARKYVSRKFTTGDMVPYLGEDYFLTVVSDAKRSNPTVAFDEVSGLLVTIPAFSSEVQKKTVVKHTLERWYRRQARQYLTERVDVFIARLNVDYNQIRIKDNRTRWASCSSKGNLNFNWRLMLAPRPVIDYVVVHEVCHLCEQNHSQAFWDLVGSLDPDYKIHRKWLRSNNDVLFL